MGTTIPVVVGGPTWSSWTQLPGKTTNVSLAATTLKGFGQLGLALTGTDGVVYVNILNNGTWQGWTAVPVLPTNIGPCLTQSQGDGTLYLYAVAENSQVYVNSTTDGVTWQDSWSIVSGAETNYPLCVGTDGNLYLVGLSGHIWVSPNQPSGTWTRLSVTGGTFPGHSFRTNAGLCMAAWSILGSVPYLFAKGLDDNKVWYSGIPSQGLPPDSQGWQEFSGSTHVGLAGAQIPGENFCLFLTGLSGDIYFDGYTSGSPAENFSAGWNRLDGFRTNAALAAAGVSSADLADGVALYDIYVFGKGVVAGDVQYIVGQWAFAEQ